MTPTSPQPIASQTVAVLGMGYVGLPLLVAASSVHHLIGYDSDQARAADLQEGRSPIDDVNDDRLAELLAAGRASFTGDPTDLAQADILIITVPTPLDSQGFPDLSMIRSATSIIAEHARDGALVILESTTYPGTTREIVAPILDRSGKSFDLAYSPERIDPGSRFSMEDIPKVAGGMTEVARDRVAVFYRSFMRAKVIIVSSPDVAEASKIFENIFREVNIALVNEIAVMFERMGIDTWEALDAAATKPFGFMRFEPGPGVGGHCIPLDPLYLSYRARQFGLPPRFIELSTEVNDFMAIHVTNLLREGLKQVGQDPHDITVNLAGLSYKANVTDTREAPSIRVAEELERQDYRIHLSDPAVTEVEIGGYARAVVPSLDTTGFPVVMILVDHRAYVERGIPGWSEVLGGQGLIIDARNVLRGKIGGGMTVVSLGRRPIADSTSAQG